MRYHIDLDDVKFVWGGRRSVPVYKTKLTSASGEIIEDGPYIGLDVFIDSSTIIDKDSVVFGNVTLLDSNIKDSRIFGSEFENSTIRQAEIINSKVYECELSDALILKSHITESIIDCSKICESTIVHTDVLNSTITGTTIRNSMPIVSETYSSGGSINKARHINQYTVETDYGAFMVTVVLNTDDVTVKVLLESVGSISGIGTVVYSTDENVFLRDMKHAEMDFIYLLEAIYKENEIVLNGTRDQKIKMREETLKIARDQLKLTRELHINNLRAKARRIIDESNK